jgi:hypothetical protein
MAKNKTESAEDTSGTVSTGGSRRTASQQQAIFTESTQRALKTAADGEKYRYKSERGDTDRFIEYLSNKLEVWEELKDKTFHATRMYEKTNDLLNALK